MVIRDSQAVAGQTTERDNLREVPLAQKPHIKLPIAVAGFVHFLGGFFWVDRRIVSLEF